MTSKISIQTIIFGLALGITIIVAAILSGGHYIGIVIPVGTGMIFSGPVTVLAFRGKSKNIDRECDEREMRITDNAMRSTFYIMAFVLLDYWAYDIAKSGTIIAISTLINCVFWFSFIISYCINKSRH